MEAHAAELEAWMAGEEALRAAGLELGADGFGGQGLFAAADLPTGFALRVPRRFLFSPASAAATQLGAGLAAAGFDAQAVCIAVLADARRRPEQHPFGPYAARLAGTSTPAALLQLHTHTPPQPTCGVLGPVAIALRRRRGGRACVVWLSFAARGGPSPAAVLGSALQAPRRTRRRGPTPRALSWQAQICGARWSTRGRTWRSCRRGSRPRWRRPGTLRRPLASAS